MAIKIFSKLTSENEQEVHDFFREDELIAIDVETTGLDWSIDELLGVGVGGSNNQIYFNWDKFQEKDRELFCKILEQIYQNKKIIFHNSKFDLKFLKASNCPVPTSYDDTLVIAWVEDENQSHGLKNLVKKNFKRSVTEFEEINSLLKGKTKNLNLFEEDDQETLKQIAEYCCADVKNTVDLFILLRERLIGLDLWNVYEQFEKPLMEVLYDMEESGIRVDPDLLGSYKSQLEQKLLTITQQMHSIVGNDTFNFNSPKQIEEYLFDVLSFEPTKSTYTGKRSTDNGVLLEIIKANNLDSDHFVSLLLEFRDLDKLLKTYVVPLLEKRDEDDRIHTEFIQTGTSSGRLASRSPNLQNIPVRDDEWNLRKVFIPKEGHKFIIADYSQIELRVLAHFCDDERMVQVFRTHGDIHQKTMEITETDRKTAKQINFGIIYGMGAASLAKMLEIPLEDAQLYIARFFAGYPKLKGFLNSVYFSAYSKGTVDMLLGRVRHLDKDVITNQGSFRRLAVNSKIQGSAADVIKKAMLDLAPKLEEINAKMLLQIHDELVIEVPADKADEGVFIVKNTMGNCVSLKVPLKANIVLGDYWEK